MSIERLNNWVTEKIMGKFDKLLPEYSTDKERIDMILTHYVGKYKDEILTVFKESLRKKLEETNEENK